MWIGSCIKTKLYIISFQDFNHMRGDTVITGKSNWEYMRKQLQGIEITIVALLWWYIRYECMSSNKLLQSQLVRKQSRHKKKCDDHSVFLQYLAAVHFTFGECYLNMWNFIVFLVQGSTNNDNRRRFLNFALVCDTGNKSFHCTFKCRFGYRYCGDYWSDNNINTFTMQCDKNQYYYRCKRESNFI